MEALDSCHAPCGLSLALGLTPLEPSNDIPVASRKDIVNLWVAMAAAMNAKLPNKFQNCENVKNRRCKSDPLAYIYMYMYYM